MSDYNDYGKIYEEYMARPEYKGMPINEKTVNAMLLDAVARWNKSFELPAQQAEKLCQDIYMSLHKMLLDPNVNITSHSMIKHLNEIDMHFHFGDPYNFPANYKGINNIQTAFANYLAEAPVINNHHSSLEDLSPANLAAYIEKHLPNARHLLKFAPVLAVSSSVIATDAIGDEAKASMEKSRDARKAGNNELADQYQSDVLIHKFRAKLKGSEVVVGAIPSVAFLTAGSLSTAVDAANEALQDITVEGRAKIANNRQLASTFQYLIHNPDKAGTVEYQAQASLVSLRPDILQAVTSFDTIRKHIDPTADPRQPFPDVLATIENNLSRLIADGQQIPVQRITEVGLSY